MVEDDICKLAVKERRKKKEGGNGIEEKLLVCLVVQQRKIKRCSSPFLPGKWHVVCTLTLLQLIYKTF